jgi:hypothetical protein
MHPLFQVTLYTGQQLALEVASKWLPLWARRPCDDEDAGRQRRRGLKSLVLLLLKSAATGMLATLLDAAIDFRRRQLLSAAAFDTIDGADGLLEEGMMSRAGIAAWKARLIGGIDELERRAQYYGIGAPPPPP